MPLESAARDSIPTALAKPHRRANLSSAVHSQKPESCGLARAKACRTDGQIDANNFVSDKIEESFKFLFIRYEEYA